MSKSKSNKHSILCDYEFFYEHRGKLSIFNDFEKNKGIKKRFSTRQVDLRISKGAPHRASYPQPFSEVSGFYVSLRTTGCTRMSVFCSKDFSLIICIQTWEPTWWGKIFWTLANKLLKLMTSGSHPPPDLWMLCQPFLHLFLIKMSLSRPSPNVLSLALLPVLLLVLLQVLPILQLSPPFWPPTSAGIITNIVIRPTLLC